jgi:hypothetical protein
MSGNLDSTVSKFQIRVFLMLKQVVYTALQAVTLDRVEEQDEARAKSVF